MPVRGWSRGRSPSMVSERIRRQERTSRTEEDHGFGHVLILLFTVPSDSAVVNEGTDGEDL